MVFGPESLQVGMFTKLDRLLSHAWGYYALHDPVGSFVVRGQKMATKFILFLIFCHYLVPKFKYHVARFQN